MKLKRYGALLLLIALPVLAADDSALRDAVVLIIRHAEKPESGSGLAPAGEERAIRYVNYFKQYTIQSNRLALSYLIATADSKKSRRPRLTLAPLSQATGLAIDSRFKNSQFQELADDLRSHDHGKYILICWHHGEVPHLLSALGADPNQLLPNGEWPDAVFGWLIQLRYDAKGRLLDAKRVNENLMPEDTERTPVQKP